MLLCKTVFLICIFYFYITKTETDLMFISSFRERSLNGEHCAANYNKYLTIFPGVIGKLLRQNLSNQRETEHQGEDRCLNGLKITVHQMKCTRVKA